MTTPHRCPVCDGLGTSSHKVGTTYSHHCPCRSCRGIGIVWSPPSAHVATPPPPAEKDGWRPMETMPPGVWCLLKLNGSASNGYYGQPYMIGQRRESEAVSVPNYSRMELGIFDGWLPIPGAEAPR